MPLLTTTASAPRTACDKPELSAEKPPTDAALLAGFKGQIQYFYGDGRGYFTIDAGQRDDASSTGIRLLVPSEDAPGAPNARVWCYYDPERPDLLEAAALAALRHQRQYGNVYLSRTLFARKRATKDSAQPSRIIAVEDAPEQLPIPASRVLRTSPASRQAFYRLVEPVSTAKAERLSRLIARVVGADRSGTNANKVLRLVGGLNTKGKYGAPWRVAVESRARDYTYDELWSFYSAYLPSDEAEALEAQRDRGAVRWPEPKERWLEHWRKHRGELMDGKMPRVFKLATHSQGYRIFADDSYIAGWKHESGSYDASTVRWVRAANLVRAGLTDEMAAAVLEAVESPETIRIKGLNAVRNDIKISVTEARGREVLKTGPRAGARGYDLVGEYARKRQPEYAIPAEGQTLDEPRAGGRPAALSADALLAFYHEHASCGVVTMTRAEVAAALHVSPATVYRLNSDLKTRGEIDVEHTPDRQRAIVRLTRLVKTSPADVPAVIRNEMPAERVTMPENAESSPQAVLVTHVGLNPPVGESAREPTAPAQPPSAAGEDNTGVRSSQTTPEAALAPLVAEAIDAYGTRYGFGQEKPLARVLAYVQGNGGEHFSRQQVERAYRDELARRAQERERARVEGLEIKRLVKERDTAQRHIKNGLAMMPQRDPRDFREDVDEASRAVAEARYQERLKRWREDRRLLRMWQEKHAHLCEVLARKRAEVRPALAPSPLLALLDEHERDEAAALAGYTVRASGGRYQLRRASGAVTWHASEASAWAVARREVELLRDPRAAGRTVVLVTTKKAIVA